MVLARSDFRRIFVHGKRSVVVHLHFAVVVFFHVVHLAPINLVAFVVDGFAVDGGSHVGRNVAAVCVVSFGDSLLYTVDVCFNGFCCQSLPVCRQLYTVANFAKRLYHIAKSSSRGFPYLVFVVS